MTNLQVQNQANKLKIKVSSPQAYMIASVINNPHTRVHFVRQAQPQLIKLYKSLGVFNE